jgi:hypothetical protein
MKLIMIPLSRNSPPRGRERQRQSKHLNILGTIATQQCSRRREQELLRDLGF